MIRILFVCHGNICRSPMAEYIMKDMLKKRGLESRFMISSAGTSSEEMYNPVYPPARKRLSQAHIDCAGHRARQLKRSEYGDWDMIIGMDEWNMKNMLRLFGSDPEGKIFRLMSFAGHDRDVSDPWYSGDFETAFNDIYEGCEGLIRYLIGTEAKNAR